jgi:hypothetical protein
MWLLPLLAKSGLVHLLIGKRLRALQHGVVPVRLTASLENETLTMRARRESPDGSLEGTRGSCLN